MYGRLFLYTPRSGSKIFARSQCPNEPRWAVETLQNGSHIIHYTAPLYRVPSSTRQHRADVGAILKHVARTADRSSNPRSLLAWDDRGEISFVADERSVMDIEQIVGKFGRGEGLLAAFQHTREEAEIFGDGGGPDTRLFAHPVSGAILHVTNGYVSTHPAHKSREEVEMEPATFGDLPCSDAQYITSQLLQALWDGMSAPVPTEAEAEQIVQKFAAWMDWPDDTHREEMKAMLLEPIGPELQDWANEHLEKHHRILLDFHPSYPAHWSNGVSEDEDEIASEPTEEEITALAEPTPEEIAAQKKNEADAAFAAIWREHLRGSIGHWMAANLNHPYPCVDADADVVEAHGAICRRVAGMWAGWSNMWWRSPDLFCRATDPDSLESYPTSLPPIPTNEEFGDSPNSDVWTEWLEQLSPSQLLDFLRYTSKVEGNEKDWDIEGFNTNAPDDWKKTINALSHAFPFPFAAEGLVPHPTQGGRFVLQDWNDLYLYRRRLPHAKFEVVRRHFAALVKMAEHAPE